MDRLTHHGDIAFQMFMQLIIEPQNTWGRNSCSLEARVSARDLGSTGCALPPRSDAEIHKQWRHYFQWQCPVAEPAWEVQHQVWWPCRGAGGQGGVLFSDGGSGALACSVATAFPPMVPSNFLKLDVVPASLLQLRTWWILRKAWTSSH